MDKQQKLRLGWVELYKEVQDAGIVCRRCGVSRPTLCKGFRRYKERGRAGLSEESRKPYNFPTVKVFVQQETIISSLRKERKLGVRRIQSELKRQHSISLSLATIHKVLKKHRISYLQQKRHYQKSVKRYNCKLPGERVQMDVCKIASV